MLHRKILDTFGGATRHPPPNARMAAPRGPPMFPEYFRCFRPAARRPGRRPARRVLPPSALNKPNIRTDGCRRIVAKKPCRSSENGRDRQNDDALQHRLGRLTSAYGRWGRHDESHPDAVIPHGQATAGLRRSPCATDGRRTRVWAPRVSESRQCRDDAARGASPDARSDVVPLRTGAPEDGAPDARCASHACNPGACDGGRACTTPPKRGA